MPDVVSPIFTPFLVIVTFMVFNFLLIIPLSGYLFLAVSTAFQFLTQGIFAPFGDALLAGIFLICVVFGIHQGFLPVYFALMVKYNINTLFPVLALAGASQVGCAIAMFFIANKGGTFRKQIASAIVPGFLGIGEPLIYGVSLPRIVPFVTACIGAMLPGFFVGALNQWGHINMGLLMPTGPSGLLALPMITSSAGV
jgi:N-acetylmuramic acid-specific PTS system IIC component